MRYKIHQKIFSFGDKFTIKNENDEPMFNIRGRVFTLGDKLYLEDLNGSELFYIEQKIFKFLPEYNIFQNGVQVAKVKKELTFFKPRFNINSNYGKFEISGDIFAYNFRILKNGRTVATVSKRWFALSDTYGVEIGNEENQAFLLVLIIVIDQVIHDSNSNNN